MNIKGHFETITRHKLLVMKYCFACGLYEQGLAHDLSKYSPTEFIPGCIYYQGDHSPNEAERADRGYSSAWLHHKGRNKHHLEYWIDYASNKTGLGGMKMPLRYVCEMVCDRGAASRIYLGDKYTDASPWEYYERSKNHYLMHPETRALLEKLLKMVRDLGQDRTFAYMKFLLGCQKDYCASYLNKKYRRWFHRRYFFFGMLRRKPKTPRPGGTGRSGWGTSGRVYSTQLLFVVIDVDIARGIFVLPQQQGGGERHSEGGKHGKQSLENFHGQEPPWSILCGAQQVLHRISNSSIA